MTAASPEPPGSASRNQPTSAVLQAFLDGPLAARVTVGEIRNALGDRAIGVLLVLFALPNLVPVSALGFSAILALPVLVLALQLSLGHSRPWFPPWLARRSVARDDLTGVLSRLLPYLRRIEPWLQPRLGFVMTWTGQRLLGVACLILALTIALPIPFGNGFPAIAIILIGLALVERDGMAAMFGLLFGIASLALVAAVLFGVTEALQLVTKRLTA